MATSPAGLGAAAERQLALNHQVLEEKEATIARKDEAIAQKDVELARLRDRLAAAERDLAEKVAQLDKGGKEEEEPDIGFAIGGYRRRRSLWESSTAPVST